MKAGRRGLEFGISTITAHGTVLSSVARQTYVYQPAKNDLRPLSFERREIRTFAAVNGWPGIIVLFQNRIWRLSNRRVIVFRVTPAVVLTMRNNYHFRPRTDKPDRLFSHLPVFMNAVSCETRVSRYVFRTGRRSVQRLNGNY